MGTINAYKLISGTVDTNQFVNTSVQSVRDMAGKLSAPPFIEKDRAQADWNATSGDAMILNKPFYYDTTANWNAQISLVSIKGAYYVYSDYKTDSEGKFVPWIKIGDGTTYVVDLPFLSGDIYGYLSEHVNDTAVHVNPGERTAWNNKVGCFVDDADEENVVFYY